MDSKDKTDLLYLTNQNFIDKYNTKQNIVNESNLDEIQFYRKRILHTTKELLRNNSVNICVDNSFNSYCNELIKYYKFQDKKDMIQEEYKNLKEKEKRPLTVDFKLSEKNQIMARETKKHIKTIKDCIPLVIKNTKKKKVKYPKKKDINIKDPKFRIKGLEKEKSKQFICPKEKHIKERNLEKERPIKKDTIKPKNKKLDIVNQILNQNIK